MSGVQREEMKVSISLEIEDIDRDYCEYILFSYDAPDKRGNPPACSIWRRTNVEPAGPDYDLTLYVNYGSEKWTVEKIEKGHGIRATDEQIVSLFESALLEQSFRRQLDIADGIEHEHDTMPAEIDSDPYDPKKIRVESKFFPVYQVNDMILDGEIDLSPDFQREFVWTDVQRRSRLIESLLLRIPLPVFYLAQDETGRYQVVDGVQRLTVLRDFIGNQFRLKNLEYLTDCNGKWFHDMNRPEEDSLDRVYVRRIQQTMLSFNVIDPQTPPMVKYDIFRRLNTGGKELNRQEIRNCFENPRIRGYINQLSRTPEFLRATRHSVSPTRMADRELILRFIAFFLLDTNSGGQTPYKNDMDAYLDSTIELLNHLPQTKLDQIKQAFLNAMENAYLLFGDKAFRKAKLINKALFLSWSRVLCKYPPSEMKDPHLGASLSSALEKEIQENTDYSDALSKGTNDARNLEKSVSVARKLLKEAFQNE